MNHIRPNQTITIMSQLLHQEIDAAERLETDIAEMESELRDANDWHGQALVIRLTAARADLARHITKAADYLRTVDTLRTQAGLDKSVLGRVMEMGK